MEKQELKQPVKESKKIDYSGMSVGEMITEMRKHPEIMEEARRVANLD
tara:strand:+ start:319 stop:462 length:144 start_codon:yes stop_codon:yes gene_type:complete